MLHQQEVETTFLPGATCEALFSAPDFPTPHVSSIGVQVTTRMFGTMRIDDVHTRKTEGAKDSLRRLVRIHSPCLLDAPI